ncbi:hypothetical protein [Tomitella biformata]|uniref:hypothetical protein n=1 Tax=Tomitella biformata TaxID=630403 RepID=UPI000465EFBD|nr:hypothetical protein [Tomitella biformata]
MKLRGVKRIAISLAASAAMVGGLALTAPATASAAPGYEKPVLTVEQGDFGGKNVQVTITNPNDWGILDPAPICTPTLLSGEAALKALVAVDSGDILGVIDVVTANNAFLGLPAINNLVDGNDNSKSTAFQVDDGVYVLVGICGGTGTLLGDSGVAIAPVIVPSGFGSIAPGLAFGSLLLESGDALTSVLPLLLGAGGLVGGLS